MIKITQEGNFKKLNSFLEKAKSPLKLSILDSYGRKGVQALRNATPMDTGKTAESWDYKIERSSDRVSITFTNSNIQNGVPIAIILQYGHGTGWGGYVQGRDYINPAVLPLFDDLLDYACKEVSET